MNGADEVLVSPQMRAYRARQEPTPIPPGELPPEDR